MIRKIKILTSYDRIKDAFVNVKTQFKEGEDIILSRAMNLPVYDRLSVGTSWSDRFGFYSPSVDINTGVQFFSYEFMQEDRFYKRPYCIVKTAHSFRLPANFTMDLSLTYSSNRQNLFIETDHQWNNAVRLSKSIKEKWFLQVGANNLFVSSRLRSVTRVNNTQGNVITDNDKRNVSLLLSYRFNSTRNRYVNRLKSGEINRY